MKIWSLLAMCLLNACASQGYKQQLNTADWSQTKCSGIKSWHDCKAQAQTSCPSGFYVKDELENVTIQRREMQFACKAS